MTLFSESDPTASVRSGSRRAGWALLSMTAIAAVGLSLLPAPYVIDQPGPTYDTLGVIEVDGNEVPLITVPDEAEFREDAHLWVTTVNRLGNPENLPSWVEVMGAWVSSERAVTPVDQAFPPGLSLEENREAARIDMENSQQESIAAALNYLDIDYDSSLVVVQSLEGGPSEGILQPEDVVMSAAGVAVADVTRLRELISENGVQDPMTITVLRNGREETLEVIPRMSEGEAPVPVIGVLVSGRYDFPFDITIELGSVGGPSAGLMFALGIVEKLSDQQIAGSLAVAGSGTISAQGDVGPVGGTRHKIYGAAESGAEWFFIPRTNCSDVAGLSPNGIGVVPVDTLADAVEALELILADEAPPSCVN